MNPVANGHPVPAPDSPRFGWAAFRAVTRCLIRETFWQSLSSYAFWLMLTVSLLCILFCLSVRVEQYGPMIEPDDIAIKPERGRLSFGFGLASTDLFRDDQAAVHFIQVLLAKWVAGTVGLLLALIWTAGFLPSFLEPDAATVLLAKPVPRWALLAGKVVGVVTFVAFQAAVFVVGTWLALGMSTEVWEPRYLVTLPLLVLHFVIIYSFSAFLAVCTRSTVVCVFGSILFWLLCYGMNYARHAALALPHLNPGVEPVSAAARAVLETGYWILPKPADVMILLDRAMHAHQHFTPLGEFSTVQALGAYDPLASLAASLLFAAGLLAGAARQLRVTNY
jgi:ABC-type transport system involved in multi-copper enzyme maturation permease subunit